MAAILLLAYIVGMLFTLKTHSYLYHLDPHNLEADARAIEEGTRNGGGGGDEADEEEEEEGDGEDEDTDGNDADEHKRGGGPEVRGGGGWELSTGRAVRLLKGRWWGEGGGREGQCVDLGRNRHFLGCLCARYMAL